MTLMNYIKQEEGCRLKAYQDTRGIWTIGYGHTGPNVHPGMAVTQDEAEDLLEHDLLMAQWGVEKAFPWVEGLDPVRKDAVVDICFNMGAHRFMGFHRAIAAMVQHDWQGAVKELRDSLWQHQVGRRADSIEARLLSGTPEAITA